MQLYPGEVLAASQQTPPRHTLTAVARALVLGSRLHRANPAVRRARDVRHVMFPPVGNCPLTPPSRLSRTTYPTLLTPCPLAPFSPFPSRWGRELCREAVFRNFYPGEGPRSSGR